MKPFRFLLVVLFALFLALALSSAAPLPAARAANDVPDGLSAADWAQIESQLPPNVLMTWPEQAKLNASEAVTNAQFGFSVALDGNTAVVGAPFDTNGVNASGVAYIFTRTEAGWNQQAKLVASDASAGDYFGYAVALSGDTAVIGAYQDDDGGSTSGSAYVFTRNSEAMWSQQAKLTANDAAENDRFGWSVAISGDTAIVGAYFDDDGSNNSGSTYVFVRTGGAMWSQQAKLNASDANANDRFGYAVAISGDTAVIGAYLNNAGFSESGSAYVFTRSGGLWNEQAKLIASDASTSDYFGGSVALSGDTAVIGAVQDSHAGSASGSAYVFTRNGEMWSEQAKLTASDASTGDFFSSGVAISGDTAMIGAYGDNDFSGSAYIFTRTEETWSEQAKLTASNANENDEFGFSVALSGDTAIIGGAGDDDALNNSGSAYVFSTQQQLAIVVAGNGSGQVQRNPAGITFPQGSEVMLTATADLGSTFTGWSGDVVSTDNPIMVTMDSAKAITATFALNSTSSDTIYLPLIVR